MVKDNNCNIVGIQGSTGDRGEKGIMGEQGIMGDQGPQGVQGNSGLKGATGDQGPPGGIGNQGPEGSEGATGPLGDKGIVGDKGILGSKGAKNVAGDTGDAGVAGDPGAQGDKGDQGLKGILPGVIGVPGKFVRPSFIRFSSISPLILPLSGGDKLPLPSVEFFNNITFGINNITFVNGGVYKVRIQIPYSILNGLSSGSNQNDQHALFFLVNGILLFDTLYQIPRVPLEDYVMISNLVQVLPGNSLEFVFISKNYLLAVSPMVDDVLSVYAIDVSQVA